MERVVARDTSVNHIEPVPRADEVTTSTHGTVYEQETSNNMEHRKAKRTRSRRKYHMNQERGRQRKTTE